MKNMKILPVSFLFFSFCFSSSYGNENLEKLFPKEHNDFVIYFPGPVSSEVYDVQKDLINSLLNSRDQFTLDCFNIPSTSYFKAKYSYNLDRTMDSLLTFIDWNYFRNGIGNLSFAQYFKKVIHHMLMNDILPQNFIGPVTIETGWIIQSFVDYYYKDEDLSSEMKRMFEYMERKNFESNWKKIAPILAKKKFNSDDGYEFLVFNELVSYYGTFIEMRTISPNNQCLVELNNRIAKVQANKTKTHVKFVNGELADRNDKNSYKIGVMFGSGKITNRFPTWKKKKFNFHYRRNALSNYCQTIEPSGELKLIFYDRVDVDKFIKRKINSTDFDAILYIPKIGEKENFLFY
jgi:hypothetical protein